MRSRSSRSTARRRRSPARRGGVDVYLLPAVVGGGLGDIEEVLAAGRALERAGFRPILYRSQGRPMPAQVDGPWAWPRIVRRTVLSPRGAAALTVAPAWGVSAAPARPGPFGRPGPWAIEAAEIERAYGRERTVHVSLEEFARTLTSREENRERLREGGVRSREIGPRLATRVGDRDRMRFDGAFRRFRAFDRPNVLHLYATFRRRPGLGRTFPNAVQSGPLWPAVAAPRGASGPRREWVWYASPASAEKIAPSIVRGLTNSPVRLFVRTPRPWSSLALPRSRGQIRVGPLRASAWHRRFAAAELRIVTGSRTLLEAIELGGPWLYFNGVLGDGSARRRHRPEKVVAVVRLARQRGWPASVVRDLADFARGRRVEEIVARAARGEGVARSLPSLRPAPGGQGRREDAGSLLCSVARRLARAGATASGTVEYVRRAASP